MPCKVSLNLASSLCCQPSQSLFCFYASNSVVSLGLSAICAGAVSFFYQGATLQSIIRVAYNGYSTSIEEGILQTILNRGGMSSMLQYVAIICFAVGMGGMLDRLGVLGNLLNAS